MNKAIAIIISSLLFLFLFVGFFHPITSLTQDLGRHLLTGELILKINEVPKTNLFSYTYPNFPFINHHWLSEVLFFLTSKTLGFNGLLGLTVLLALLSFFLIFFFILKQAKILAILFTSALYFPILFERTDVRPELFSFLFLSVFLVMLYSYRKKFTYWIFLLIPLELLWVNMHIYFAIGIAVLALFFIDCLLSQRFKLNKHTIIIGAVLIFSTLTTFLNPNGVEGALYPLFVFRNYGYSIEENQNIFFLWNFFHKTTIFYFFIAAPLLFISLALNFKKTKPIDFLLSIFFTTLAILSVRNFPLFVLGTFIPFAKNLSTLNELIFEKRIFLKNIVFLCLISLALFQSFQMILAKGFGFGTQSGAKKAVDFFIQSNLQGPIFNNFDIGSYLEYRLYPKEKVFVDGRPEAYPASFFKNVYIPMQKDSAIFKQIDNKYHFQTIFFSHTDQTPWGETFLNQIVKNNDWNMVYLDDYVVILTKEKKIKSQIQTTSKDLDQLFRLSHFFHSADLRNQEIKTYQDILTLKPNFCPVLYNLSLLLAQNNDPSYPIFLSKFQYNCRRIK